MPNSERAEIDVPGTNPSSEDKTRPFVIPKPVGRNQVIFSYSFVQSAKPQWDEFFAFELVAPAFAVLKVKVMDHIHCWKPQLLGEVSG